MIICNLKHILDKKKIPITRLSLATGIKRPQIYKFINNKVHDYSTKTVSKLCDYLGVNADELLTFISCNLKFHIINEYSRTVAKDNNGSYWVHLVLSAVNPHYYVNNAEHSAKSIGYFNFDARITAELNKLLVAYQFSQSIPLYNLNNDDIKPIKRDYLRSVADNKHNLMSCVLLAISLHNIEIIRDTFPGSILNDPNNSNSINATTAKIKALPAVMLYGNVPERDINRLIVDFDKVPNLYGTASLNKNSADSYINRSSSEHDFYFMPVNSNPRSNDIDIFGSFDKSNPQHYGGNGINYVINEPHKNRFFINQRFKTISNERDEINRKYNSWKRKINKADNNN